MAEQEYVRAYQRTLSSGTVVQVDAHNRTNADVGTAARKQPGRPPLAASGGNMPNGRSLPNIWVMPDAAGAAKAAQAQTQITQNQQAAKEAEKQPAKPQPEAPKPKPVSKLSDLAGHPDVPKSVSDFAQKLGGFPAKRTTLPAKDTTDFTTKILGKNPPPGSAAEFAKKLGLSAETRDVVGKLKNIKYHDPALVTLASLVDVKGYKRTTKMGVKERVRAYIRHEDLAPDLGAKKGVFSGVGAAPAGPQIEKILKFSNPHFNPDNVGSLEDPRHVPSDLGYNYNCVNSVTAFELNMRGQHVSARPVHDAVTEGNMDEFLALWRKPNGEVLSRRDLVHTGGIGATDGLVKSWPEGARGWVMVQWERDSAHVFTAIHDGDKARFVSPQSGIEYPASKFREVAEDMVWAVRADDLKVGTDMSPYVEWSPDV